jgi:hypothetical protein
VSLVAGEFGAEWTGLAAVQKTGIVSAHPTACRNDRCSQNSELPTDTVAHRDIRTGTGACFSNVRVTPPNTISTERAWV